MIDALVVSGVLSALIVLYVNKTNKHEGEIQKHVTSAFFEALDRQCHNGSGKRNIYDDIMEGKFSYKEHKKEWKGVVKRKISLEYYLASIKEREKLNKEGVLLND